MRRCDVGEAGIPRATCPRLHVETFGIYSDGDDARTSAQQALDLAVRVLANPGDAALMEDPGYFAARAVFEAEGLRIVPVPVDREGMDVDAGIIAAPGARLAYVTPSHQHPLGVMMSLPRRLALLQWATRARAWVVEDDYDSEFRYGARAVPCLHGLDVDGRVIYVGSFSKTLFPALRLGFLIVPADLVDALVAVRTVADQHPPVLDQAILADFIEQGHFVRHLRRMRVAYRERLEALTAAADRCCRGALRVRPTRTGLHIIADLDGADAARVSREAATRGVEATALAAYCVGREKPANALVLGFAAVRPEAARRGMERLAASIEAARRR